MIKQKISILLVDDDPESRLLFCNLSLWTYYNMEIDIHIAVTANEALSMLARAAYYMVVTEIQLDDMEGLSFLKNIQTDFPCSKVVVCTVVEDFHFIRGAFLMGVVDYLIKPTTSAHIGNAIKRISNQNKSNNSIGIADNMFDVCIHSVCLEILNERKLTNELISTLWESIIHEVELSKDFQEVLYYCFEGIFKKLPLGKFCYIQSLSGNFSKWVTKGTMRRARFDYCVLLIGQGFSEIFLPTVQNSIVQNVVMTCICDFEEINTVDGMSKKLFLNRSYLSHMFKNHTNISLSNYMITVKIYMARILLMDSQYTEADVSEMLGYKDLAHFKKIFKTRVGCLPKDYIKIYVCF